LRSELASQRVWRMGGVGMAAWLALPVKRCRRLAPEGVDPALIPLASRVPGILVAARYDSTSTLSYSELGLGILARPSGGRLGFYCAALWVDNAESCEAGRDLWGLPKAMARFDWQTSGSGWSVRVETEEAGVATLSTDAPRSGLGVPFSTNWFSFPHDRLARWTIRSRSVLNQARIGIEIPGGSPLSDIGIGRTCRGLFLDPLHLAIRVPRAAGGA